MTNPIATLTGIPSWPTVNLRTGPAVSNDLVAAVNKGTGNLAILDVQPDSTGATYQNKLYQWFKLSLPDGRQGWARDDLVGVKGDLTRFGYGVVSQETVAYFLTRHVSANPCVGTLTGMETWPVINVRASANAASAKLFEARKGLSDLPVLEVKADEAGSAIGGRVYQWIKLRFEAIAQEGWVRDDLVSIRGDCAAFGYGTVSSETLAANLTHGGGGQPPVVTPPVVKPKVTSFELGHALVGIHGPADPGAWPWNDGAISILKDARIEAVKVMAWGDLGSQVVNKIKSVSTVKFIMARIHAKFFQARTAAQYVAEVGDAVKLLYDAGVVYFEVHNEPNLHTNDSPEGMWIAWQNGREFGAFFAESVRLLRQRFPNAKFGWPGISPGGDYSEGGKRIRYDSARFLSEADSAVRGADWIGMHTYWGNGGLTYQNSINDIKAYCNNYPDKVIFATEFSNSGGAVKATKGTEYANFYDATRSLPANFGGAFSYVLSSSGGYQGETWSGSEIPGKVNKRKL